MIITEALGHALVIEPYIDTVVVCGGLLHRAGGPTASLLQEIIGGDAVVALAAAEPASGERWHDVSTVAERDGDGWVLNGRKMMVVGAPLATHLLATARTPGVDGISLFLSEVGAAGIKMHPYRTIDDRRAADITFNDVRLGSAGLLGEQGQAWPSLSRARDEGAAAVCSEAVGCMRKVLADTVEYCKQRQQFGQPIGRFQVLQHRMVDMYMELEQSVAAVYLAILRLDADEATRARAVSSAKATIGRAARFIGQQSVQLHGGMGMTEELAIGHYFKRLTAIQYEFGTTDQHIARYAELTKAGS
jgi:alkylation response protein AidB-like acyl-CoA dehydrogenase